MVSLGLAVVASSRVVRDRKMGGGGGCGLACYRYNKCRDNSSGSNLSSAEGNLSISPGYLIFKKCSDPPENCDCGQVKRTTRAPIPLRPLLTPAPDLSCTSRWYFSCWIRH